MPYPLCLCDAKHRVSNLFGRQLIGTPYEFDFSPQHTPAQKYTTTDFEAFQEQIFGELGQSGRSWGVGRYLENRSALLTDYPHLIAEQRVFHAGLDIVVPHGFRLHAPLQSVVHEAGIDAGLGNYGGYVILKHQVEADIFFSFYGHLGRQSLPQAGDALKSGQCFATIGEREDSGHWFTHTHLQILSEQAIEQGRTLEGYVTAAQRETIDELYPSPYPLFRYESSPNLD